MKNFILLVLFLKLLFTQDNIEGRWHLVGYENSIMYEFIHTDQQVNIGLKYTIYSLDSSFNNLEDNLGGTPNPYNITGNIITIDYHFGNVVSYEMKYYCDGQIVNFYNVNDNENIHSTLFRENFNYANSECSECFQMDEEQCVINDDCEWIENINTGSCSSLSINECDLPEYGSCYSDCTNWGNYYNGMFCYGTMYCTGGSFQINNGYCEETNDLLGDINQDNMINILDILYVVNLILNENFEEIADINQDQFVNVIDILLIVEIILNI